mmetsp:Transcript_10113/g.16557  ORF Transcript_10113/g.16557 Transcript_10113/m.16557 type:complete len:948 (+) Transcript_10113:33-2876(+)
MDDLESEVGEDILIESEGEGAAENSTPAHNTHDEASANTLLLVAARAGTVEESEAGLGHMSPPLPQPVSLSPAPLEEDHKEASFRSRPGKLGPSIDADNDATLTQEQDDANANLVANSPSHSPTSSRSRGDLEERRQRLYDKVADLDASSRSMATVHGLGKDRDIHGVSRHAHGDGARSPHSSRRHSREDRHQRRTPDASEQQLSFADEMTQKLQNISEKGSIAAYRRDHPKQNERSSPHPEILSPSSPTRADSHSQRSDLPDLGSFSHQDTMRLTKIQANARGLLVRKHGAERFQLKVNGNSTRHPRIDPRDKLPTELEDLPCASTKTQAGASGFLASDKKKLMEDRHGSSNTVEDLPDLFRFTEEDTAAVTKIQAGARGLLSRKQNSARPHRHVAPTALRHQASNENLGGTSRRMGVPDLSSFTEEDTAKITKIQAGTRGLLSRKRYSVKPMQNQTQLCLGEEHGRSSASSRRDSDSLRPDRSSLIYTEDDTAKITRIQATARGMLARKQISNMASSSSVALDCLEKENYTDDEIARLTKVQAAARGHLVRKHARENQHTAHKTSSEDIDLTSSLEIDTESLIRLQATARGHLVRKRMTAETRAVLKIQAMTRGRLARKQVSAMHAGVEVQTTNASAIPQSLRCEEKKLVPVKPPGRPRYGRRSKFRVKVKALPKPEDVLSEEALIERAERKLGQMMHSTRKNLVAFNPRPPSPPPRFALEKLSSRARDAMLHTARVEAEAWLNDTILQAESQKRFMEVEAKLSKWHQQREAAKQAEEARLRALEEEKEKIAVVDHRKWRKRGERLRDQVAQWGAEKAMREEKEGRDKAAAAEAARKLEAQKMKKHRRRLKAQLAQWYQDGSSKTLPPLDAMAKTLPPPNDAHKIAKDEDEIIWINPCLDLKDEKSITTLALKLVYGSAARAVADAKIDAEQKDVMEACKTQAVC